MLINKIKPFALALLLLTTKLLISHIEPCIVPNELVAKCLQICNGAECLQKRLTLIAQRHGGGIKIEFPINKNITTEVVELYDSLEVGENTTSTVLVFNSDELLEKIIFLKGAIERQLSSYRFAVGEQQNNFACIAQVVKDRLEGMEHALCMDALSSIDRVNGVIVDRLSHLVSSFSVYKDQDDHYFNGQLSAIGDYIERLTLLALEHISFYKHFAYRVIRDHADMIRVNLKKQHDLMRICDEKKSNDLSVYDALALAGNKLVTARMQAIEENDCLFKDQVNKIVDNKLALINDYRKKQKQYDAHINGSLARFNKIGEELQVKQQSNVIRATECASCVSSGMSQYARNCGEYVGKSVRLCDQIIQNFDCMRILFGDLNSKNNGEQAAVKTIITDLNNELIKAGYSLTTVQRVAKNDISQSIDSYGSDSSAFIRGELSQLNTDIAQHYVLLTKEVNDVQVKINERLEELYMQVGEGLAKRRVNRAHDIQIMVNMFIHDLTVQSNQFVEKVEKTVNAGYAGLAFNANENYAAVQQLIEKKKCVLAEQQARLCIKIFDAQKSILQDIGQLNNITAQLAGTTIDLVRHSENQTNCMLSLFHAGLIRLLRAFPPAIKAIYDIEQVNSGLAETLIIVKTICAIVTA